MTPRQFFLYHNGAELSNATATATCAAGTFWNTTTSLCTLPTVTYNANGATGGSAPVDSASPYNVGATVTVKANT